MIFEISKITIPEEPGIYLMKDSKGEIIYIGKAKNLKNRVKSYFLKKEATLSLTISKTFSLVKQSCVASRFPFLNA